MARSARGRIRRGAALRCRAEAEATAASTRGSRGAAAELAGETPGAREPVLVLATDASLLPSRPHPEPSSAVAAAAWVASDGAQGAESAPADTLAAELRGIALALEALLERPPMRARVLTDSTAALAALRRAVSQGRSVEGPAGAELERALAALAEARGRLEGAGLPPSALALEHVRAHRGDPLNEAAHALALAKARSLRP
ncbi:hypothetical protein USB125703_00688 [Pseudoclavibacter triregionum]|nr:hypothetical protein USB125703_00688 [Pseudoclavibacter triregionum]